MSAERRWLTEDEINRMIESALNARQLAIVTDLRNEIRNSIREAFRDRDPLFSQLRDSAQQHLTDSVLLHGLPSQHIKGFIPETIERLVLLEENDRALAKNDAETRKLTMTMHEQNRKVMRRMLRNQSFIKRCIKYLTENDGEGKPRWKSLWGMFAGLAALPPVVWFTGYARNHLSQWVLWWSEWFRRIL